MIILGSGMSGCLAAVLNGSAIVIEASPTPPTNHNAVLRFRTDSVSRITGIPFKKVNVRKAISYKGELLYHASHLTANLYSKKVTGKILQRSIWNLDPVERFIAPPDFHRQLLLMIGDRVHYGEKVTSITNTDIHTDGPGIRFGRKGQSIISTMPMPITSKLVGIHLDKNLFSRMPIVTSRHKLVDCDVNQTIYYPDSNTRLYRATITGGDLILEYTGDEIDEEFAMKNLINHALPSFGLRLSDVYGNPEIGVQNYGKIAPVADVVRKSFMFEASRQYGVFSLGRFAIWKNILLDDVLDDVFHIRKMVEQSHYDLHRDCTK